MCVQKRNNITNGCTTSNAIRLSHILSHDGRSHFCISKDSFHCQYCVARGLPKDRDSSGRMDGNSLQRSRTLQKGHLCKQITSGKTRDLETKVVLPHLRKSSVKPLQLGKCWTIQSEVRSTYQSCSFHETQRNSWTARITPR